MATPPRSRWPLAIAVAISAVLGALIARRPVTRPLPAPEVELPRAELSKPPPWGGPVKLADRAKPRAGAPNIVLVITCTMRRDQLTPYGGPKDTSPWMASLAANGARFDDVISGSAWTKESVTAILSGSMAIDVGMIDPSNALGRRRVAPEVTLLAEHLTTAGWWAAGRTANPHVNPEFGFAQGMDRYQGTVEEGFARPNKRYAADLVDASLKMLRERTPEEAGRPFYLQLVVIDPHWPIQTEPAELAKFLKDDVPVRLGEYRAMVRRVDDALATLDAGLKEMGYDSSNTEFVVAADHGEGLDMPAHHRGQHGRVLYRSLTQVGWILRGPGIGQGVVVNGLASQLDILPTLLGLAGLPTAPPADELQAGYDWSALLREGGRTIRTQAIAETWYEGANRGSIWTSDQECQKDWGSKWIPNDTFDDACYDRTADPDFTTRIESPKLASELNTWREGALVRYGAFRGTGDAAPEATVEEQLEALGYAQ